MNFPFYAIIDDSFFIIVELSWQPRLASINIRLHHPLKFYVFIRYFKHNKINKSYKSYHSTMKKSDLQNKIRFSVAIRGRNGFCGLSLRVGLE